MRESQSRDTVAGYRNPLLRAIQHKYDLSRGDFALTSLFLGSGSNLRIEERIGKTSFVRIKNTYALRENVKIEKIKWRNDTRRSVLWLQCLRKKAIDYERGERER